MCNYCGEIIERAGQMVGKNMSSRNEVSVQLFPKGKLVIETRVDHAWANIRCNFCPKCGRALRESEVK